MSKKDIDNINISSFRPLITPVKIREELPMHDGAARTVLESRRVINDILNGNDQRKLVIMGPCSIHDPKAAIEYAHELLKLRDEVKDHFFIVMRTYFEKPRTTVGWKGFINDPHLDNSFDMNEGLIRARKLLIEINALGLPVATESLEPISPQYLAELIAWTAIGARTTESQTHRELASGLSSPVGFKNNTDGNVHVAINAIKSALSPHHFLGIDQRGQTSIVETKGNPSCHLILRGGKAGPNYHQEAVGEAQKLLREARLNDGVVIDCSHDNSSKNFQKQTSVFMNCIEQIVEGNNRIVGLMLESHLYEGNQELSNNLRYGVSITDACLDIKSSKQLLQEAVKALNQAKSK